MKVSDIKKVQKLIDKIQECSNQIEGIKKYLKDYGYPGRLCIEGAANGYFSGFYLTEEETENVILRLENDRLALIKKLEELGVEMD